MEKVVKFAGAAMLLAAVMAGSCVSAFAVLPSTETQEAVISEENSITTETNRLTEIAKFAEGSNDVLVYRLFTPSSSEEKVPLVLYLHGAGAIGEDNITQLTVSDDALIFVTDEMQAKYPCYVLAPQLPARYTAADESPTDEQTAKGWTDEEVQQALIATIKEIAEKNGNVDMNRIYVTGHSMGALGVWGMIAAYPDTFAAAIPISGLWEGSVADLTDMPIWIFHGENDSLVPLECETRLRDELEALGGNVQMTIYSDEQLAEAGVTNAHMANVLTYKNQLVYDWLFAQKKADNGCALIRAIFG